MLWLADLIPGPKEGVEIWQDYGFAGVFIFLTLSIIVYLFWLDRTRNKEMVGLIKESTQAINGGTAAAVSEKESNERVVSTLDANTKAVNEMLVYLKTRAQYEDRGRGRP